MAPIQAVYLIADGIPTDYRFPLRRSDGKIVHECCCVPKSGYIYHSIYPDNYNCHDEDAAWSQGTPDLDAFTLTVGGDYSCSSAESQHAIPAHSDLRFYLPIEWLELNLGSLGTIFTVTLYIRQVKPMYGPGACMVCGGTFDYGSDDCGNSELGDYTFVEGVDESEQYYVELTSTGYTFAADCDNEQSHPHVFEERIRFDVL